jgi:hypothetical protein
MITITLVQGLTFILYVTFITIRLGVIPSISDSWYLLPGLEKSLFTWFCWVIGGLMLFQTNGTTPFFFLSGGGLMFVGAATMFKTDEAKSNIIHPLGAFLAIMGGLIGLAVERHTLIPLILFIISLVVIYLIVKVNKTWWIEILAFITILLGLLIK